MIAKTSEWVVKFNSLSRISDIEVHVIHRIRVIITHTLELLSSLIYITQSTDYENFVKKWKKTNIKSEGNPLTHWGRVTHICVIKLTVIGSDNGLSPGRRQAIIWTNDGILFFSYFEIPNKFQWNLKRNSSIFIHENAFANVVCAMAPILSRPQCITLTCHWPCGNQFILSLRFTYSTSG